MKNLVLLLTFFCLIALSYSCNQNTKTTNENVAVSKAAEITYQKVDEIFATGEKLTGKTVHVRGIIEHVCKHGGKRFKIINPGGKNELKIELGENFKPVDQSILGNTVRVSGKLVTVDMDADKVKQWEQEMRDKHKGEENTPHFKEEIAYIQSIHKKITDGEIPYFTMCTVDCEKYEFEEN